MPPPKRRHTRSRRDKRRASAWKLTAGALGKCAQCGAARAPHHVCPACGFYNGQLVLPRKVKKGKTGEGEGGQQPPKSQ